MFSLASLLNKIQQRFSYRRRFLFFALVFFIVTPYPAYWVLRTQKAFISQLEIEINGLKQFDQISHIFYLDTLYTYFNDSGREIEKEKINNQILEQLSILNKNEDAKDNPVLFGEGFHFHIPIHSLLYNLLNSFKEYFSLKFSSREPKELKAKENIIEQRDIFALAIGILSDIHFPYKELLDFTLMQMPDGFSFKNVKDLNSDYHLIMEKYPLLKPSVDKALNILIELKDYKEINYNFFAKGEELRRINIYLINEILSLRLSKLLFNYYLFIVFLIIVTVAVIMFVIFRVLTRHLLELSTHIEALAQGDFSTRFYPPSDDEFSQVGLTLNDMANTLSDLSDRIHSLGIVLTASSEHLTYEVKTHETNVHDQEEEILGTAIVANKIAEECRTYVEIINDLSNSASHLPLTQNTQKTLASLRETIDEINRDSKKTVQALEEVHSVLIQASLQTSDMTKISEEVHMLALNAAIEANSSTLVHPQFHKITHDIEQFAQRTSQATSNINIILKETSDHIIASISTIKGSLDQLEAGSTGVKKMHDQLQVIDEQARLQIRKFEDLNNAMKKQTFEAESIIDSVSHVRQNAKKISDVFQQLHFKVQLLGEDARELKHLLEVFFSKRREG